jgi:hypothetical protein
LAFSEQPEEGTGVIPTSRTEDKEGPIFVVTEENDLFTDQHTDRHYTQGLKLTYLGGDNDVPPWVLKLSEDIPRLGLNITSQNLGYVFGQNIYTPEDILASAPIKNDRPYAGWLYGGAYLQRRGEAGNTGIPIEESFEVDIGVTGKASLAGTFQTAFHREFDRNEIPNGWHNQIPGEPGLLLKYQRFWRLSPSAETARYIDFIPHVGGEVGNIMVFQNLGGTLRVGVNLPDDFGVQIIDSPASSSGGITSRSQAFSFYAFAGADGRYVEHNIFLDGASFQAGPSVQRIPWVADLSCGAAMRLFRHVELSYTRVARTTEFVGQHKYDLFGSIEAKAMFLF